MNKYCSSNQKRSNSTRWLTACLLLFLPCCLHAANPLIITSTAGMPVSLQPHLDYFDPGAQDIRAADIAILSDRQWQPVNRLPATTALNSRRTFWLRLLLENHTEQPMDLVLDNSNPMSDSMEIFSVKPGSTANPQPVGTTKTTGERSVHFSIETATPVVYFIKIRGYHARAMPLSLHSQLEFYQHQYNKQTYTGMIDGIVSGLVLYNLILGFKTRQPMYFAYLLLGICNLATLAVHQDFFTRTLSLFSSELRSDICILFPALVSSCIGIFIQVFFETVTHHRKIHNILNISIVGTFFLSIMFMMGSPIMITTIIYMPFSVMALAAVMLLCFKNPRHKPVTTGLILAGIAMPGMSGIITLFAATGIASAEQQYMPMMQLADTIEMLAFSLAMASRISQLQTDHDKQQRAATEEFIHNSAYNELLAHINHEIRTPLNGIVGAAELLQRNTNPQSRARFEMIYNTGLSLKILLNGMLDINAISKNKKHVVVERFELSSAIKDCYDLFIPESIEKKVRLFFSIDIALSTDVSGDPHRLRQIILNLLGNAFKFTHDGEIALHVEPSPGDKQLYLFSVSDTGIGINPEDEKRLFGIFEQGSIKTGTGTGLGLSIVRELSELLGGTCGYRRNEGKGSTFWFTARVIPHLPARRSIHQAFDQLRILIADSSEKISSELARYICSSSSNAIAISDGNNLAGLLGTQPLDALLLHQDMEKYLPEPEYLQNIPCICFYHDDHEVPIVTQPYPNLPRHPSAEKFLQVFAKKLVISTTAPIHPKEITSSTRTIHALVAEDNQTSQFIIRGILDTLGITCDICNNGLEAEKLFYLKIKSGSPYALVLMDCEMPVQDGFATAEAIRKHEKTHSLTKRTPIIAVTAHTEPSYRFKSHKAGMDEFISKPITISSMRAIVSTLTENSGKLP